MIRFFILLSFLFAGLTLYAQESKLAQQYYKDGEYQKSAALYKKLYLKHNRNDYYFRYYFNSLVNLGEYKEADKAIKEAIKKKPDNVHLLVRQGGLFEKQDQKEKAEKLYEKAIKKLDNNRNQVIQLGSAFNELKKYDYAQKTYEKGVQLSGDETLYASSLASLYYRSGDQENMVKYYLIYGKQSPNTRNYIKQIFERQLSDTLTLVLKNQLYTKIQEDPEEILYVDILAWLFIQNKDYKKALRQIKSLDKRLDEDGKRVFDLAQVARNDKDYKTAINAYEYIAEEKSSTSPYYLDSKRLLLYTRQKQLELLGKLPEEELLKIREGYVKTLEELGKNNLTALLSIDYAEFEAFYMNDLNRSINILKEVVSIVGLNERVRAEAKLDLGDYYLMTGEIWEGSLLFSQVDKKFQEGYLGELARFKNAKLSYFNGDFEWSKIQLDVLKRSTTKLIANDAIDLSVFISENTGLDSTTVALQMYANAELMGLQNKHNEAFASLDSIAMLFPDHELEDDIWYLKANIHRNRLEYDEAVVYYKKVIEKHADDIRGDNAMYELADLYENQLNKQEEAQKLYETIFIDYSGSTYAIEARRKYRELTKTERFMRRLDSNE